MKKTWEFSSDEIIMLKELLLFLIPFEKAMLKLGECETDILTSKEIFHFIENS